MLTLSLFDFLKALIQFDIAVLSLNWLTFRYLIIFVIVWSTICNPETSRQRLEIMSRPLRL